jgi:hypothetical protein
MGRRGAGRGGGGRGCGDGGGDQVGQGVDGLDPGFGDPDEAGVAGGSRRGWPDAAGRQAEGGAALDGRQEGKEPRGPSSRS